MARKSTPTSTSAAIEHDDAAISQLVELGLTTAQSRAYMALLHTSPDRAGNVAARSGVSRTKVYEVLQTLESLGFVTSESEQRAVYGAVEPTVAIPQWLRTRERRRSLEGERDESLGERLMRSLPTPESHEESDSQSPFEPVIGNARSSAILPRLARDARRSLDIMQMPPFMQPRKEWNIAEAQALARGVQVRILNNVAGLKEEARVKEALRLGAEVRAEPEHPMKLVVRDETEAAIAVRHSPRRRRDVTSLIVRQPDLVRTLTELFRRQWESAAEVVLGEDGTVRVENSLEAAGDG